MLFSMCWSRKTEGQVFSGVSASGIKKALSLGTGSVLELPRILPFLLLLESSGPSLAHLGNPLREADFCP